MNALAPERLPRLPLLTAVRFPAALVVFLFHLTLPQLGLLLPNDASHAALREVADPAGGLGVTFFFVLSGFVIAWSHRPGDTVTGFWRRRFVKILPLYWISGLLAVAVNPDRIGLLPIYLVMGQAWFSHPAIALGLNAPGWSLCVEAFFYALFPFAVAPILRWCTTLSRTVAVAGSAAATIVGIVLLAGAWNTGVSMPLDPDVRSFGYWIAYVSPLFRLPEFIIGGCLAVAVRAGWCHCVPLEPALVALAVGYAVCLFVPTLWSHRAVLVVPCAWLVLALAVRNTNRGPGRTPRWAMLLGELSFGFYLFHYPVLELSARLIHDPTAQYPTRFIVVGLVALVITLGLSWLLYVTVERPLMLAFGRRISTGPNTVLDGAATSHALLDGTGSTR